jgi:hypothetical protein
MIDLVSWVRAGGKVELPTGSLDYAGSYPIPKVAFPIFTTKPDLNSAPIVLK